MTSLSQSFDQFYDDDILRSEDADRGGGGGKGERVRGVALGIEFFTLAYQKFKMANSYSRIHRLGRVLRFEFVFISYYFLNMFLILTSSLSQKN